MKTSSSRTFAICCAVVPSLWLTACGPNVKTYPSHAEPKVFALGMKFRPVTIKGGPTDGKALLFCIHETRRQDYEVFFADPKRDHYLAKYTSEPASDQWKAPTRTELDSTRRKPTGRQMPLPTEPDHPVVFIAWGEAMAFCDWLTDYGHANRQLPATMICRLPTDHEWSCAAGGLEDEDPAASPKRKSDVIEAYPWQQEGEPRWDAESKLEDRIAGNLLDVTVENTPGFGYKSFLKGYDDGFAFTSPVKSFLPNRYGLYDISGNASEWVSDNYLRKEHRDIWSDRVEADPEIRARS